jgi:hypothetical protein
MPYVTRSPRRTSDDDEEWQVLPRPHLIVFENDEPTGILDPNGHEIYRVNEPIGFRFSENETQ